MDGLGLGRWGIRKDMVWLGLGRGGMVVGLGLSNF